MGNSAQDFWDQEPAPRRPASESQGSSTSVWTRDASKLSREWKLGLGALTLTPWVFVVLSLVGPIFGAPLTNSLPPIVPVSLLAVAAFWLWQVLKDDRWDSRERAKHAILIVLMPGLGTMIYYFVHVLRAES
jgi:hypothetical protein